MVKLFAIALAAGLLLAAQPAWACPCPKAQMLKKHGTISAIPPLPEQPAPQQPQEPSGG